MFSSEEITSPFKDAVELENVWLPEGWRNDFCGL